jgi:hypothetical protein
MSLFSERSSPCQSFYKISLPASLRDRIAMMAQVTWRCRESWSQMAGWPPAILRSPESMVPCPWRTTSCQAASQRYRICPSAGVPMLRRCKLEAGSSRLFLAALTESSPSSRPSVTAISPGPTTSTRCSLLFARRHRQGPRDDGRRGRLAS